MRTYFARRDFLRSGVAVSAAWASSEGESETKAPLRFEELAGFELAEAVKSRPFALLPLGSLEYHGPHNPLGTDSIVVSGIAERVAARTRALLFPTVCFTHCPAHTAHFQGTLSVRPDVMTLYMEDILSSVRDVGFRRIFVLNGHDGNVGPARGAISKLAHDQPTTAALFASWWEALPREEMSRMGLFKQSNGGHGHGGPLETSAVAAFRADCVHLEKATDLSPTPDLSPELPYYLEKDSASDWPGYAGRVSEASPVKGKQIIELAVSRIVNLLQNWLNHPDSAGSW